MQDRHSNIGLAIVAMVLVLITPLVGYISAYYVLSRTTEVTFGAETFRVRVFRTHKQALAFDHASAWEAQLIGRGVWVDWEGR